MSAELTTKNDSLAQIQTGLEAFETKRDSLASLAGLSKDLKVESYDDKQALKLVSEARKKLKAERVDVQKQGKAMRDLITPISKYVSEKEKELVAIISPEEERLQAIEDWSESEYKRIEQERIEAENKRIQDRIDQLSRYGYQIDYNDIKSMSDETFEKYLAHAKSEFEKEQEEKAEAERIRLKKEEDDRIERERIEAQNKADREELERLRQENAEREAKLKEAEEKQKAEADKLRAEKIALRREKLISLGMSYNGLAFIYGSVKVTILEVETMSDEDFGASIPVIDSSIAQIKAEEAAAKQKEIEDAKARAIQDHQEAENARIAEAKRQAELQPDKKKIADYIQRLKAVDKPVLKSEKSNAVLASISELLEKIDTFATDKIAKL